jgi:hypothetical protein
MSSMDVMLNGRRETRNICPELRGQGVG